MYIHLYIYMHTRTQTHFHNSIHAIIIPLLIVCVM